MGYHYVNSELVGDGEVDILQPEALVYANFLAHEEKPGRPTLGEDLQLVAVEYLLAGTGDEEISELPDLFDGADDLWLYNEAAGVWTLHVWVWFSNPMGIFNETNPRIGSGE